MNSTWEKSTNIIKDKLSQQNFDTWIRPIKISSCEGDQVQLSVPNRFFRDWLLENYLDTIQQAVSTVTGVEMTIELLVGQNVQKQDQTPTPVDAAPQDKKDKLPTARVHSSLNPQYSFERFVVGACNQFAHAASMAVADQPAKNYNPLFIYGGVGLGKTHLLNAIGLRTLSLHQDIHVLYVSAEEFMNELINCIRYNKMPQFREKYRYIDCLLLDDVQFIAGKERTQEEFFHTFNTLHDSAKQIVVTSDKFPKDIPNLESRLRSRFEWGLIADIQPPEMETKVAIIAKKAQENGVSLSANLLHYIASHAESNIRELEGFLIRICAYSSLTGRPIDMDLVKEILKDMLKRSEREGVTIEEVLKIVANRLSVKISDIKSQKKNKNIVQARQIAMYLARQLTDSSFPDIGEKIGGRDHSTVIYACNKVKRLAKNDGALSVLLNELQETLHKA